MGRVIGVFSGKGGVGKTTFVANIGVSLKKFNKNVVVIDSNFSTSHLGLHLGLYEDPKVTLREVLLKKASPTSALYIHPTTGLRLLPSPLNGYYNGTNLKDVENVVKQLKKDNDFVIVDAAPGLGREVVAVLGCIDEAIIVVTPDIPSVTDALKTINLIKKVNDDIDILGLVVNRVRNEIHELTKAEIESACNIKVITYIPEDGRIPESIAKGVPVVQLHAYSKASIALNSLSAAIIGENYEPTNFIYKLMKMLGVIKEEFVTIPKISSREEKEEKYERSKKSTRFRKMEREETERGEEEIRDIKKLRRDVSESIKSDIKNRLDMKIKEKLRERGIE